MMIVAGLAGGAARAQMATGGPKMLEVPRLDGIVIDGEAADWADRGLKIEFFAAEDKGFLPPPDQYDVRARLGWDAQGLLVLVDVTDADWSEASISDFWRHDSIGIFLGIPEQGTCEFSISPGMDEKQPELRMEKSDGRSGAPARRGGEMVAEVKRTRQGPRCILEARVPWSNFEPVPTAGSQIGMLLVATDAAGRGRRSYQWSSAPGDDWRAGQGLVLGGQKGSPAVNAVAAAGRFEKMETGQVQVCAAAELAGKSVQLSVGSHELAHGMLAAAGRRSEAVLSFPAPVLGQGKMLENLVVQVEGEPSAALAMANVDAERMRELMRAKLSFGAATPARSGRFGQTPPEPFEGEKFPEPKFEDPNAIAKLAGPCRIETKYYDAQGNLVTTAARPGLYVGVAAVTTEGGVHFRRFRALVRTGEGSEAPKVDRMWWNNFKRRYYGLDKKFTRRMEGPKTIQGAPAMQLHAGTAQQAELNEAALKAVDEVCKRWAEKTGEPFGVVIARHGVVALNAAYGQKRDGSPATTEDTFSVASVTKLLAGELSMMAVDQGLIVIDDPVAKYLPAFGEHGGPVTVTLRNLYVHTTDIPYAGEGMDFEESAPLYVSYARVGKAFDYNTVGPSLIRRVIETVTDEDLGSLYQRCLFGPLGCKNASASDMERDARGTPMDFALCGQMLLNHGAYGKLRFFSEECYNKMLPPPGIPEKDFMSVRGIGLRWYSIDGLGKRLLGHNSATESILRVDLDHDMVIVNVRSAIGPDFPKYQREFFNAVAATIKP
jgi:CubicO group peptidase (beta-lactamase class C family)